MIHDLDYLRWRDQSRRDLSRTAVILALIAIIVWVATATPTDGAAPARAVSHPVAAAPVWLTINDSGDNVTEVQTILADNGWTIAVDGQYGPITEAVVTRFQQVSGLLPDGIVGPVTWGALQSVALVVRAESEVAAPPAPPAAPAPSAAPAPESAKCPQWWDTARQAGWSDDELPKLDIIMWGESRCDPTVLYDTYHSRGGGDYSFGLVQVNVKPGAGTQALIGPLVDWDWTRLYDPLTNLTVARAMADTFASHGWSNYCQWWGWTTRDRAWCG